MGTWVPNVPNFVLGGATAINIVNEQFDTTTAYTEQSFRQTQDYITNLQTMLNELSPPSSGGVHVEYPYVPDMDYSARPGLSSLDVPDDWPENKPVFPTLIDMPDIADITLPVMGFSPPILNTPTKPVADNIEGPGDAPVVSEVDIPAEPSIVLPDAPILENLPLPTPPTITIPAFDEELTPFEFSTPQAFNWSENPYNSPVWVDLLAKVRDGLINGGTGLGEEVENDIWDRARNRQARENDKLYRQVRDAYSIGYCLPPGSLAAAEMEIASETAMNNTNLNSDIAVKQAELAKEHSQFITSTGVDLEKVLRGFHDAQAGRSMEAAKTVVSSSIDILNAVIAGHNLKIEQYKAEASIYEARVKAALTDIEIYKANVEAVKVSSEMQKNLVAIYEKQIAAVETHVKLYSAKMESAKIRAEIEQLKIENFKAKTQAYSMQVEAEKMKFDIYAVESDVEKTKVQIFAEQAKAYLSEVETKKIEADLESKKLENALRQNTILIEGYKGELAGYLGEIEATGKKVAAVTDGFKAEVAAYAAETDATGQFYGAKIKEIDARIEEAKMKLEEALGNMKAVTDGYVAIKELQVKGTEGIMNVGAQLTSAAMNAVNASASIGTTATSSTGKHLNHSQSLGETHSYRHE